MCEWASLLALVPFSTWGDIGRTGRTRGPFADLPCVHLASVVRSSRHVIPPGPVNGGVEGSGEHLARRVRLRVVASLEQHVKVSARLLSNRHPDYDIVPFH